MNAITQNQNFIVTRDGEVTDEYEPSALATYINASVQALKLEVRMIAFDVTHGTHYRRIRRSLIEQKKRRDFEASIGLIAS